MALVAATAPRMWCALPRGGVQCQCCGLRGNPAAQARAPPWRLDTCAQTRRKSMSSFVPLLPLRRASRTPSLPPVLPSLLVGPFTKAPAL